MDCAIGGGFKGRCSRLLYVARIVKFVGATSRFPDREIGGVTVDVKSYTAVMVANNRIGIGGRIVEEMRERLACYCFGGRFFGRYCVECDKYCVVNCSCVIEEAPTIFCTRLIPSGGRMGKVDLVGAYWTDAP